MPILARLREADEDAMFLGSELEIWHVDEVCDRHDDEECSEEDYIYVRRNNEHFIFSVAQGDYNKTRLEKIEKPLTAALFLAIIITYLMIRRILRPIKTLSEGARQVGKGDLDHRVEVMRSDEIGEMAGAFNDMATRIQAMIRARERLLLDVSHELRSPLTRIKVAGEFIADGEMKESIREDVLEMEAMITEILETARMKTRHGNLNLQCVNLADLIRKAADLFADHPPGVDAGEIPDKLKAHADADRVKTVLGNIVSSAVKYSGETDSPVTVTSEETTCYIVIRVTNQGIGIPPDELPYAFEPFYRVDKSRSKRIGGYGLGLGMCRTIMTAHRAGIVFTSEPGRGTEVSLYFPKAKKGGEGHESV